MSSVWIQHNVVTMNTLCVYRASHLKIHSDVFWLLSVWIVRLRFIDGRAHSNGPVLQLHQTLNTVHVVLATELMTIDDTDNASVSSALEDTFDPALTFFIVNHHAAFSWWDPTMPTNAATAITTALSCSARLASEKFPYVYYRYIKYRNVSFAQRYLWTTFIS